MYDAATAEVVKPPADRGLYVHVQARREYIALHVLRQLGWFDTVDMLADALTKGSCERESLLRAGADGVWLLKVDAHI